MIVKLCGFTDPDQAAAGAAAGATHIGAVLWDGSRRGASEEQARAVFAAARRGGADAVAVLVDAPDPADLAGRLGATIVQLHGEETLAVGRALAAAGVRYWRALRVSKEGSADPRPWLEAGAELVLIDALVADAPGGTGVRADAEVAARLAERHPVVLAGGLSPLNVAAAVRAVRPLGVDVASGIERAPGDKDVRLMRRFVREARAALLETR
jgi:phosphoribosylanthranilate isomerase